MYFKRSKKGSEDTSNAGNGAIDATISATSFASDATSGNYIYGFDGVFALPIGNCIFCM